MNPVRALDRLAPLLDETSEVVGWPDERLYVRIEEVSAWSPAQHVDHVLRALDLMWRTVEGLESGRAEGGGAAGGPTLVGRVVLLTGWIPRGRGEAPSEARPDPRPVRHRLRTALGEVTRWRERLRARVPALERAAGRAAHHHLGAFDAAAWLRFSEIHTRHHLAIVAEIDRRRAAASHAAAPNAARTREEPEYGVGAESP